MTTNARDIEKRVETLITGGRTKKEICRILSAEMDRDAFDRFLRNRTELSKRKTYYAWNILLVLTLGAVTFFKIGKLFASVADTGIDNLIVAVWSFLVPAVNVYLLYLIYRFNRLGYMFVFVLSILSLLRPEYRSLFGLIQTVPLVLLSGFLYMKLFPKGGRDY